MSHQSLETMPSDRPSTLRTENHHHHHHHRLRISLLTSPRRRLYAILGLTILTFILFSRVSTSLVADAAGLVDISKHPEADAAAQASSHSSCRTVPETAADVPSLVLPANQASPSLTDHQSTSTHAICASHTNTSRINTQAPASPCRTAYCSHAGATPEPDVCHGQ